MAGRAEQVAAEEGAAEEGAAEATDREADQPGHECRDDFHQDEGAGAVRAGSGRGVHSGRQCSERR